MPRDTGITETCYYFEDGNPWWTSPDIRITGPNLLGIATRPSTGSTVNTVRARIRRKGAAGDPSCLDHLVTGDSDYLQVDLYVCPPNASALNPNSTNIKKIRHFTNPGYQDIQLGTGGPPYLSTPPTPGSQQSVNVSWNLPENPALPHSAEGAGHKCLVARVYSPPQDSPSNSRSFQVDDDQHYAQTNICINVCNSPCGLEMMMFNEDPALPRQFQLRVVQDLKPNSGLQQVIDYTLRQAQLGEYKLSERSPEQGFGLTIKEMPNVHFVKDQPPDLSPIPSEEGCLTLLQRLLGRPASRDEASLKLPMIRHRQQQVLPIANLIPSYEGRVMLAPSRAVSYTFRTDLEGEASGTVHVFHVMEIEDGIVQGGVTLLMVKQ